MSDSLIGRAAETAAIRCAVSQSRLVTVTGLPGVGKTAAAMTAARTLGGRFRDGIAIISLDTLLDETLLPHSIGAALLLPDTFTATPLAELTSYLAGKRMLLLLDTCEHLLGSVAMVATAIGETCRNVHILATSREPLRVPGEQTFAVGPLPAPDAVSLLSRYAPPGTGSAEVLDAICARLDGLPLAISLAGRQLGNGDSAQQLLTRLKGGYDFLTSPDAPVARHRSLAAAIGWSHQLCTPAERLLWARAAVFDDAFCLAACQQVCASTHLTGAEVAAGVSLLAERSLLLPQPGDLPRYFMPLTIRSYGMGMLRRLDEEEETRRRYRRWRSGPREDVCWQLSLVAHQFPDLGNKVR